MLTGPSPPGSVDGLSFLWLEITPKCNLECTHCYAEAGPWHNVFGVMQTEDWLTVIREAAAIGCRQLQFIGGEPTLHPDLAQMISYASERGCTFVEVFTNATALSPALMRAFAEHNVRVATSFYSDDPATHEAITRRPGSFRRTVAGIRSLLAAGVAVRAGIIEMPANSGHSLRARHLLEQLGVTKIEVDFQRGVGRAARDARTTNPMAELCGQCWRGTLCVTPFGRVYPCVFSRFADLGSIQSGVQHITEGELLRNFRSLLREYCRQREAAGGHAKCDPQTCAPATFPLDKCRPRCHPHTSTISDDLSGSPGAAASAKKFGNHPPRSVVGGRYA